MLGKFDKFRFPILQIVFCWKYYYILTGVKENKNMIFSIRHSLSKPKMKKSQNYDTNQSYLLTK